MKNKFYSYRRVVRLNDDGCCPLCNQNVTQRRKDSIELYNKYGAPSAICKTELYYCDLCRIPLLTEAQVHSIEQEHSGRYVCLIVPHEDDSVEKVQKQCASFPEYISHKKKRSVSKESAKKEVPIKTPKKGLQRLCYIMGKAPQECPVCGKRLHETHMIIPLANGKIDYFPAITCGKHFIAEDNRTLRELLYHPEYNHTLLLDYTYHITGYRTVLEMFNSQDDCGWMIILKEKNINNTRTVFIGKKRSIEDNIDYLDYRDHATRGLLANVFHDEKIEIKYDGSVWQVCSSFSKGKEMGLWRKYNLFIKDIHIKKDGGLLRSVVKNRTEIVDILLYSPYTKCYEIVHATFDSLKRIYYMDIGVYRRFVENYGNPGITLNVLQKTGGYIGFSDLNEESLLHAYGYNVSEIDGYSDSYRQKLLAEIIDLELLSQRRIISHLRSCIRRGSSDRYFYARQKWDRDIQFVIDYKANPQRFLIAKI